MTAKYTPEAIMPLVLTALLSACGGEPDPAHLNEVSQFARHANVAIQLDIAANEQIHGELSAGSISQAYSDARDASRGFHEAQGYFILAPTGYDEAANSWYAYTKDGELAYGNVADALNDPSLGTSYDALASTSVLNPAMSRAIKAFKGDLRDDAALTDAERNRILSRLYSGKAPK